MYTQEIVFIWVIHMYMNIQIFNISLRKKRTTIFLVAIIEGIFVKMGNVKKDGHTGGVREMSICRIATATVNI